MEPYAGDAAARRLAVLDAVAAETGCQPGQVMLAWMAAQRGLTAGVEGPAARCHHAR
jgi:aryl-alcohol dehydrogenase-like predicted oxidoreductase